MSAEAMFATDTPEGTAPGALFLRFSRSSWNSSREKTHPKLSETSKKPTMSHYDRSKAAWVAHRQKNYDFKITRESNVESPVPTTMRERLEAFYSQYNPARMSEVGKVVAAYAGREAELFTKLRAKYCPEANLAAQEPLTNESHPKVYFDIRLQNITRRVVMRLLHDKVPLTAENFRCLCTGEMV
jgi:hypothetical protein